MLRAKRATVCLLGILKYFTLKRRSSMPNPDVSLSKVVPSEEIHYLQTRKYWKRKIIATSQLSGNTSGSGYSRGPYEHFTIDDKYKYKGS